MTGAGQPQPVRLRPAAASDATALAEVFLAAWRAGYRGVVPDDVIDSLDAAEWSATLGRVIDTADRHTIVAVDVHDLPVGFASYGPDSEHPGDGYLASLYVHPRSGGTGIGSRLLRHVLDSMAGMDVRLWVFDDNTAARRLYERAGFRPDGARLTDPRWRTSQSRLRRPAPQRG